MSKYGGTQDMQGRQGGNYRATTWKEKETDKRNAESPVPGGLAFIGLLVRNRHNLEKLMGSPRLPRATASDYLFPSISQYLFFLFSSFSFIIPPSSLPIRYLCILYLSIHSIPPYCCILYSAKTILYIADFSTSRISQ
jgi:hypothetical protein